MGGLALAFAVALGVGALLGSAIGTSHAAGFTSGGGNVVQTLNQPLANGPGAPGHCAVLTVSSVSGNTIVAKAPDGSTVTIHTTASTQFTRNDQAVAASAVTVGSQIRVFGTHDSDGSITATRIDLGD
jgi:hypothetical protein